MASPGGGRPVGGKWFEDLRPGLVVAHAIRRTITEADNVLFTTMMMNPVWSHLDFVYAARETEFGRPLVNSMLTLATTRSSLSSKHDDAVAKHVLSVALWLSGSMMNPVQTAHVRTQRSAALGEGLAEGQKNWRSSS